MADQQTAAAPVDVDTIKEAYAIAHAGDRSQSDEPPPEGYAPAPEGEAGEHGERVTEQAEQPPPIDLQTIQDAYRQVHPPDILEQSFGRMGQFDETVLKRLGIDITGGVAGLAQQAAVIANLTQAPNLQGLSVDQVSVVRDQMVKQKADVDAQLSRLLDTGIPDDAGIRTMAIQASSLDERIKQADGIIASGQATFEQSPTTSPVGGALRAFGERAVPAVQRALDQLFPTDQDFVNSFPGQIATGGADAIYLAGTEAVGVGLPAAVGLFGNQAYQDAKEHGASDETAERASLMTGLVTAPTMTAMGPLVGGLAESFAGLTPKEGIQEIIKTATHIVGAGGVMSTFQLEQNAIAKLSGYDPDRRMDEGTWQAFWTGIGWGSISQMLSQSPRLARLNQPDVTVRNKAGTPAETGPQTTTEAAPATQPVTTGPAAEAQAAAQANIAATTPEQVLAQQGTPEQQLAALATRVEQEAGIGVQPTLTTATPPELAAYVSHLAGAGAAPAAEVRPPTEVTTVQPGPPPEAERASIESQLAAQAGRPIQTPEELEARRAAISAQIEEQFRPQQVSIPWWQQEMQSRAPESTQTRMARGAADEIRQGQLGSAVFLSDIANRLGLSPDEVKTWAQEASARGEVNLDVGHWPSATPEQRAAAVPVDTPMGRENRLLVRFPEREEAQARTGTEPRGEIPETSVNPTDVKREVNRAQEEMGMQDHLRYVPNAEALPDHVKAGLTVGERGNTAQIVHDNKLGDTYVIGNRFSGLQELRRAIIEEALPAAYRRVTDLGVEHDPSSRDFGRYDPVSDRPSINTHAILRSTNPYAEASRSAMEEVNVHQGISRLVGRRDAQTYVDAMNSVQRNFDRLGLNDILAQKKGYADTEAMAKDYGYSDYTTNPRSQHKLTEELIGAYSRTFRNPQELAANGPSWYQNALRGLNNGIRRSLGIKLADYDVQSLLADSAGALRKAKYNQPGQFHPQIDAQAKRDMADFQFRNKAPEGEEHAAIGTELVKARAKELQAGLQPGEFIRQQPWRLAMDPNRSFRERMGFLNEQTAVDSVESHQGLMRAANQTYERDFAGNPNVAMESVTRMHREMPSGGAVPALAEVTNRKTIDSINDLKERGFADQASLLEAKLDRFNMDTAPRVTESARELSAQRLRHLDGSTAARDFKTDLSERQVEEINKPVNQPEREASDKGLDATKQASEEAASKLTERTRKDVDRIAGARRFVTTKSLPEQYTEDLVKSIDDALNKVGKPKERAPLEDVYNTFRQQIQQVIREMVTSPERPKGPPLSATDTLRTVFEHHPYYAEAWKRTVDKLQETNPELYQALDRAAAEPIGQKLADRLAIEHGQDLSDLIYRHFSNVDRITEDLANKIAAATGIPMPTAISLSDILQQHFKDIVQKEQKAKLQQILDSVGGTGKPAKSELDRLADHIVLGSLDSKEWLNLVAPRFGIQAADPQTINELKQAGDYYSRLRDDGLSGSVISQKVRRQIGDLTRINSDTAVSRGWRYLNDVYGAGLITSPITHAPYYQQAGMISAWDSLVQGLRTAAETKDPMVLVRMFPQALAGYARGMQEFGPVMRGIKAPEEFLPEKGARMLYSSPMEKTQFDWQKPQTWFSRYKYARNFLDAVSNLLLHGPEYGALYANASSLAWDQGLRGQDAWDRAAQVTLGSSQDKADAVAEANRLAGEYKLSPDQTKMLQNELLDKYKTTSDLPMGSAADEESKQLTDLARRARATGLAGTLRGEVPGFWGGVSRGLIAFASKVPAFRSIAPFLKIPFKAITEFQAWSPIGFWRSIPDLVPTNIPGVKLVEATHGGIQNWIKDIPGMEARIKSGEVSPEMIRDLAWNQMSKAIVGTSLGVALAAYQRSQLSNPNPPFRITYLGPSDYNQQQIERGKGWQPRSVYFGGAWHSYENTPFRMLFAGLGAWEDSMRYDKQDPNALVNEGVAGYKALSGFFTSAIGSPLQGLDAVLNAASKVQGSDAIREAGNFAAATSSALLTTPFGGTAFRHLYRLYDPTEYQATGSSLAGYAQKFMRNMPVVNSMFLEPKLNVFGEKLESTPLHNIPEYASQVPSEEKDPVWHYLATHPEIKLSMPGNPGTIGKVKATPEEIYQLHLARGPYLKEQLANLFASPSFNGLDGDRQNAIVKRYEQVANKVGDAAVYRYRQTHPNPEAGALVQ